MYLREVKRRNKDGSEVVYYQLAQTQYDKSKHQARVRVVHTFGRSDAVDPAALRRLSASLLKVCGPAEAPAVEIGRTYDLGLVHAVDSLWDSLGVASVLRRQMAAMGREQPPFDRLLMALTAFRLNDPAAKRGCYEYWLPQQVWLPESRAWELETFYRSMDFYREHASAVEEQLFHALRARHAEAGDLVFLDLSLLKIVTAEGPVGGVPGFATGGPSEERAFVRIWAGLAVSAMGMPIRTWTFPEGMAQNAIQSRMEADIRTLGLTRIAYIGEAAASPPGAGRSLIWAAPLTDARQLRAKVLGRAGSYHTVNDWMEIKEVQVNSGSRRRRYIICRNPEVARQERSWRSWVLKLLVSELQALDPARPGHADQVRELRSSPLFRSYLRESRAKQLTLDAVKVNREARMDGKCVLTTNDRSLSAEEIAHSDLGTKVAREFFRQARIMGLRPRPMFHMSLRRIEAHVRLCFLIILVQRFMELHSGKSWEELRRILETCKVVQFRLGDSERFQQTRANGELAELLEGLGVPARAVLLPFSWHES